jgi:hypothetical protein
VFPSIGLAKAIVAASLSDDVIALEIARNETNPGDAIVGTVFEGHKISYFADRKNIVDSNFLYIKDADSRLADLRTIYTSAISSKPIEIMEGYNAKYILFTHRAKEYYNISKITYVNEDCFPLLYSSKNVKVYERKCGIS